MRDTPFRTPRPEYDKDYLCPGRMHSDSEERGAFNNSENPGFTGTGSSNSEISLAAEFDELVCHYRSIRSSKLETELAFADFVEQSKQLYIEHYHLVNELKRCQFLLDEKKQECTDLEHKLTTARIYLDLEKHRTRAVKKEMDEITAQIIVVRDLLKDKTTYDRMSAEEMRQKIPFLDSQWDFGDKDNCCHPQLSAQKEINSTGSILSDFSYSRSETDLDSSHLQTGKGWKKHRPSTDDLAEPAVKKRRSGNQAIEIDAAGTLRTTTTLTVCKDGPITTTSTIESVPKTPGRAESTVPSSETCTGVPPANLVFESRAHSNTELLREHNFQQKLVMVPENCTPCNKRVRFGKTIYRCKDCKVYCHMECKDKLPLPCIPQANTPNRKNMLGVLGDYTPTVPPMVPAILIHCINEIELRGLTELGVYRIPGAKRNVKALKERFLKDKRVPCLKKIDVHTICGTVKDFLRSLHEPLLTNGLRNKFYEAIEARDPLDVPSALLEVISELPQPNRDTLAYMILHLQKVSEAQECKMTVSNLAKVFGPTIVGFSSSEDPDIHTLIKNNNLMEHLIKIPSAYWDTFMGIERNGQLSRLQRTPSTDSLLCPFDSKGFFTPPNNRKILNK